MRIINTSVDYETNYVFFYCRDGEKKIRKVVTGKYPYLTIERKELDSISVQEKIKNHYIREVQEDGKYAKLYVNFIGMVNKLKTYLEENKIKTYESNIHFAKKVMLDNLIPIGSDKLKILYFDFETDDTEQEIKIGEYPILSSGCIDSKNKKKCFVLEKEDEKSEREMLINFIEFAKGYDILVAYNGWKFDFPYLEMRAEKLKIPFNWNNWQRVDLMDKIKSKKHMKSYSLQNVAMQELKKGKVEKEGKVIDMYRNNRAKFIEYNLHDVELTKELDEHFKICEFLDVMSSKTNVLIEDLDYPTSIVDICVLRKIRELKRNVRFQDREKAKKEDFQGAYVLEPKAGLYKNALVLDFTSLYNRICQSWNISPETLNNGEKRIIVPGSKVTFSNDLKGIIPLILEDLEKERDYYKKKRFKEEKGSEAYNQYDMLQNSVKIILLVFYGVMGNPSSRYCILDIAESVTAIGRYLIKISKSLIENKGFKVIYAHTDSLWISLEEIDLDKQIEIGYNLARELNDFYMKALEEFNINIENRKIEMKFERIASQVLFLGTEEEGTKNRYAGMEVWEEGKKINQRFFAKGIELVRGDWNAFAQGLQKEVLMMIFSGKSREEIEKYIEVEREIVKSGKLTKDDLTINQMITKPIDKYTTKIPHVEVAKKMKAQGIHVFTGMKIPMIFIKIEKGEEAIYSENYREGRDSYDAEYYWNFKIYPPTERILKSIYFDLKDFSIAKEKKKEQTLNQFI